MNIIRAVAHVMAVVQKKYFTWQLTRRYSNFFGSSKVLFWVPGGFDLMLHVEGAIASALKLRGKDVHAVICDGPFRACVQRKITDETPIARWHELCPQCKAATSSVLDMIGIKHSFIGDFVPEAVRTSLWEKTETIEWNSLKSLSYGNVNIGNNVRSSIIRYLKGKDLAGNEEIVREYAFSGLVAAAAASAAFERILPERIFMSHGTYVDWGPALHTSLDRKLPVTAWMASYLNACFYFRHISEPERIDFHNMSSTAWNECKDNTLSNHQEMRLDSFLNNRYKKQISFDMKKLKKVKGDIESLRKAYGCLPDKPVWGIISHINWDAVSDYSPMAFNTFDDWMLETIREIIQRSDVNWLIKIHPAEAWDNPETGVQALVEKHFPLLPRHVKVISAEDDISPLDFYQLIDGGITVYGTAGLELALHGKPVILAGEGHYGGKGFTYDGLTQESYRQLLRNVGKLKPLSDEQRSLARKYAYCYFIQRQVPLPVVKDPVSAWWKFQFKKWTLLLPGEDPFMDFICERIMDGKDFIMDEKLVELAEKF